MTQVHPSILGVSSLIRTFLEAATEEEARSAIGTSSGGIEYNSNANGSYIRLTQVGVQICWVSDLSVVFSDAQRLQAVWTYPAAFSSTPVVIPSRYGTLSYSAAVDRSADTVVPDLASAIIRVIDPSGGLTSGDSVTMYAVAIGSYVAQ